VPIVIRHLADSPEAAADVATWHWPEWGPFVLDGTLDGLRRRLATWVNRDKPPMMLVAFADEQPVGSVSLVDHDMERPAPELAALSPWLSGLFVVPSMRRRGVGSVLVRACEEHAERLGSRALFLYTERARGFYERLGWSLTLDTRYEDALVSVMARSLHPN
jgi:GNAT superfamily N-acetyltransferase